MDTRLTSALRAYRARYPGEEASGTRLFSWLLDHAPSERRAIKAVSAVAKLGLHDEMERSARVDGFAFRRMVDALTGREALPSDLAEEALLAWLAALDKEPPDPTALRGPIDKGLVAVRVDALRTVHLALVQSGFPIVSQVCVESLTPRVLSDLSVSVWFGGAEVGSRLRSSTWSGRIERLKSRQLTFLDRIDARIGLTALHELQAPIVGRYWIEVKNRDEVLLRTFHEVEVVPAASWLFGRAPLAVLAAFVAREDPVVAEIVGEAAARVAEDDARPAALRAWSALVAVVEELALETVPEPPQRVGSPRGVLARGRASWLELQLLYAACLEHAGIAPVLVWTTTGPGIGLYPGHERPQLTETDDAILIQRLVEAGAIDVFPIGATQLELSQASAGFAALDVTSARRSGVLPMSSLALDDGGNSKTAAGAGTLRQRLLDRAQLASNRSGVLLPGAWATRLVRRTEAQDSTPPRLQTWKRRLLDLTLNNPLLNLRTRVTSLPLCIADLPALEEALASGRAFRLQARPDAAQAAVTREMMDGAMASGGVLVDLPERRTAIQAKNANRTARAARDEGGVHVLFLSLGILEWFELGKSESRFAPLVLVPVLIRRARTGHFEIKKAELDTELNAGLLEYLRREHGVEVAGIDPMPTTHNGVDVKAILDAFSRALAAVPTLANWKVHETAQIAVLAFSGFRMWRDLDHQAQDLMRHPLVRRLVLGGDEGELVRFIEPGRLDDEFPVRDILTPLEADGSQLAAIVAAVRGGSFVLEGPPGTGKSQTIANLIAQCLALGKTVLFVSQKRAALEVVESRLEELGFGPFLLELHSKKASKPEFIEQLRVAADFRAKRPPKNWSDEANLVEQARSELNGMMRSLNRAQDPGLSVFQAIGRQETSRNAHRLDVSLEAPRAFDASWLDAAKLALVDISAAFERLGTGWEPLEGIRATEWPKARRSELEAVLADLLEAAKGMAEPVSALERWFPGVASASADDLDLVDLVCRSIEESPRPRLALIQGGHDELTEWLDRVEHASATADALAASYLPDLVEQDLPPRIARMKRWLGVFLLGWLVLLGVRWFFRPWAKGAVPSNQKLLSDLEAAHAFRQERDSILEEIPDIKKLVGKVGSTDWKLPKVDEERTREWVRFSRELSKRATRYPAALELAAKDGTDASQPIARFRSAYARFATLRKRASELLKLAGGFSKPKEAAHLQAVSSRVEAIQAVSSKLRDFGAYVESREKCFELGLRPVVKTLEQRDVAPKDLVESFSNGWLAWWTDQRVLENKALSSFDRLKQSAREVRFGDLDRALNALARHEIQARLAERKPHLDEGAPPNSQAGILLRQFHRRAGFASPRQLFSECAGLIRQLKPCVLMSPQSVAQYLDPSQPPFDLVVFDEASQVPTHEAIGAIARGSQVIVVGDSKQLPPTAFFTGQSKDGEEDEDGVLAELDSILEECVASGLPSARLRWHYRSRHPSLIAFSNARYYDTHLQVLPAARSRAAHLGVSRVLVQGAIYDRGGTATNRKEAEALVADLVRRLRDPVESQRTLGVVTFSRAQQSLVEDLIEDAREAHPEIEPFFDAERQEPVIIKNLENIQGDERDVILFSIGYGPDARGRMTANLGPLGQLGGERRLNVAVTRAREQLVVFVSFEPAALDLSAQSARGLHDLKAFLEAAASADGVVATDAPDADEAETALKRALATRLEAAGHAVEMDVGVGAYRMDLAVRHRKLEGAYVLGVEIDGPRLAAADTARDRDRLRWDVLRQLGWNALYRARALDWYEDSESVVNDILAKIDEAENHAQISLTPPPVALVAPVPDVDPEREEPKSSPKSTDFVSAANQEVVYRALKLPVRTDQFAWRHSKLPGIVADVVKSEGPIGPRLIGRRIMETWSLSRTPQRLTEHIAMLVQRIPTDERPIERDGFWWPPGLDPNGWRQYRIPDPEDPATRREVDDISLEEIANAIEDLLVRYGHMPREDLARATAKRFGFRGLTRIVAQRVDAGLELAEKRRASRGAGNAD
jgi:hypothetical protein